MAGSYADVPGYRFAYDLDGTTAIKYPIGGGAPSTILSGDLAMMNQDQLSPGTWGAYNPGDHQVVTWLFPEIRNISGYFMSVRSGYTPYVGRIMQTSADTTSGIDGTWTTVANPYQFINSDSVSLSPSYRSSIQTVNFAAIKALRFNVHQHVAGLHLYGTIATTESPDRLRIVDTSNNDIAAQLDFGNIPQRASSTKQFKIINNSATLTANNITVSLNVISNASPSLIGQYQVSTDNVAFANAVNIGSLAPGASTGTMYVRDSVANNAQLSTWAARIIAHPTSWS